MVLHRRPIIPTNKFMGDSAKKRCDFCTKRCRLSLLSPLECVAERLPKAAERETRSIHSKTSGVGKHPQASGGCWSSEKSGGIIVASHFFLALTTLTKPLEWKNHFASGPTKKQKNTDQFAKQITKQEWTCDVCGIIISSTLDLPGPHYNRCLQLEHVLMSPVLSFS